MMKTSMGYLRSLDYRIVQEYGMEERTIVVFVSLTRPIKGIRSNTYQ